MQFEHLRARHRGGAGRVGGARPPNRGAQARRHLGHLPRTGEEHEGVDAGIFGQGAGMRRRGSVRDVRQELPGHPALVEARAGGGSPPDLQRLQSGRAVDDGGGGAVVVRQQGGEAMGVHGGGHRDEAQVPTELADLGEHADEQVRLEAALVHLVEDDGGHPGEGRIREEAAQQDPGRDELDQGARPGSGLAAHGVGHPFPGSGAVEEGQASGSRARSDPAGLGDNHPPTSRARRAPLVPSPGPRPRLTSHSGCPHPGATHLDPATIPRPTPKPHEVGQQRRDEGGLARARWRLDDGGGGGVVERGGEGVQGRREHEPAADRSQVEGPRRIHGVTIREPAPASWTCPRGPAPVDLPP